MNATQKYELIRLILKGEKTPKQASKETGIPISTIYYYLISQAIPEGRRQYRKLSQ